MDSDCSPGMAALAASVNAACSSVALQPACLAHELHPILEHGIKVHQDLVGMLAGSQQSDMETAWAGLLYKVGVLLCAITCQSWCQPCSQYHEWSSSEELQNCRWM